MIKRALKPGELMQNIPVRAQAAREIRDAFLAREPRVWVETDYADLELRLLAQWELDS